MTAAHRFKKIGFTLEKVYINFRINFKPYITKISNLKHNYLLMLKSEQDLVLIILAKHDYFFLLETNLDSVFKIFQDQFLTPNHQDFISEI